MERDAEECAESIGTADFNSRAHVERDAEDYSMVVMADISTHALTWSATFRKQMLQQIQRYFNSRAHVERDR